MTKLTKADIDALVSLVESCGGDRVLVGPETVDEAWLRRALYLAAGLQADGSPKSEKVRCWMYPRYYRDGAPMFTTEDQSPMGIPGHFIPDGAE